MKNRQLNQKFGLITGGMLLAIAAYQFIFNHRHLLIVGSIGGILLVVAALKPQLLNPFRILWDKIGGVLGIINTYIILSLVFFLMITPLGGILRLLNKNLVALKWSKDKDTYWQPAENLERSTFEQQF